MTGTGRRRTPRRHLRDLIRALGLAAHTHRKDS